MDLATKNLICNTLKQEELLLRRNKNVCAKFDIRSKGSSLEADLSFWPARLANFAYPILRPPTPTSFVHNIFQFVSISFYHEFIRNPDIKTVAYLVNELANAYLWANENGYDCRIFVASLREIPQIVGTTLVLSLHMDSDGLSCRGFRKKDGQTVSGVALPYWLGYRGVNPESVRRGLFLIMASLSAQIQLIREFG